MLANQLSRFGTPIFVMVSGYLLINSTLASKPLLFYRQRLNRLFIPLIFWNIFYYLLDKLSGNHPIGVIDFLHYFYQGGAYYHLYFLPLILGLYFITPLLNKAIKIIPLKFIVPPLLILSQIYLYGYTWLGWPQFNKIFSWFIPYIGYYLAGVWVATLSLRRIWPLVIIITIFSLLIASFFDSELIMRFGLGNRGTFPSQRLSLLIAIPSLVIFYSILKIPQSLISRFYLPTLAKLANLTFGVYLIHPAVISIFQLPRPAFAFLASHPLIWLFFVFSATIVLSFYLSSVFKRLPILSRLV